MDDYWIPHESCIPVEQMVEALADQSPLSSLRTSPISFNFDELSRSIYHGQFAPSMKDYAIPYGMPIELGSADTSPLCSPRSGSSDLSFPPTPKQSTHTIGHATVAPMATANQTLSQAITAQENYSQRRRAQNRAAQRAFRERKEKHTRELETQLAALTEKYRDLESDHADLQAAYEKTRKTIELLMSEEPADEEDDGETSPGRPTSRRGSSINSETMRKLMDIFHGEVKVKSESSG